MTTRILTSRWLSGIVTLMLGGFVLTNATSAHAALPPRPQPQPAPMPRPNPNPNPTPKPCPQPNGYIDTSWQNDPLVWYRIHHHGQNPPWWWWNQYYPNQPYPVVVPVPIVTPNGGGNEAPAQAPAPRSAPGKLRVFVPDAKAEVSLNGTVVPGLGMKRWIDTPEQVAGQSYRYDVTVTWTHNGHPVTESRDVTVQGGQFGTVDFTVPSKK